ncbi:hypothetical protein QBC43DRAFT_311674 [Cladorrhinum sp. PSN259]|nr:hypothetical protein QBC43DRAFT_311674 [Cladorrhinum sp. PSN259]
MDTSVIKARFLPFFSFFSFVHVVFSCMNMCRLVGIQVRYFVQCPCSTLEPPAPCWKRNIGFINPRAQERRHPSVEHILTTVHGAPLNLHKFLGDSLKSPFGLPRLG